jgi:hypothetical protein
MFCPVLGVGEVDVYVYVYVYVGSDFGDAVDACLKAAAGATTAVADDPEVKLNASISITDEDFPR